MPDAGRRANDQHVLGVPLTEPVVPHRGFARGLAPVEVLGVEQFQCDAHTGELGMRYRPVRLRVHALVFTSAREQQRIHRVIILLRDIVPTHALAVGGREYREDAPAGHGMRGSDRTAREALGA